MRHDYVVGQRVRWISFEGTKDGVIEHVGREHLIVAERKGRKKTGAAYCVKKAEIIEDAVSEKTPG